ncbi:MAG: alpha/beta fold hydrolase [Pseudonocardiaceae bacterium]|nr:alpha/beta fold hydrolase [Pseudonocardiaceae bacterium]
MSTVHLPRPDTTLVGTRIGSGPPILLLHAGGENRRVWSPVAARLAEAGFTALAYDQRGHGDSDSGDADTLPPFAGDVAAMIDALAEAPIVVGASLGGLAALLALAKPELERRVAGLVLVDVVPDPPPARTRDFLRAAMGDRANAPIVSDILGRGPELNRIAARLAIPVLLVRGARSPVTDDDVARLTKNLRHLAVAAIPGAGHLVARDAPTALAQHILGLANDTP